MREIKFRGKATLTKEELDKLGINHNGGWIIGNLIIDNNIGFIVGGIAECDTEYIAHEWWVEVDIETVGQYIGLKDKNSKEIYEGDILIDDKGKKYLIKWGINSNGFIAKTNETHCNVYSSYHLSFKTQVIGNIYENKELLEEE